MKNHMILDDGGREAISFRRTTTVLALTLAFTIICLAASPDRSSASPEPFSVEFTESLAHVGDGGYLHPGFNGVTDVIPPEPAVRVRVVGQVEDGQVTVGSDGFKVERGSVAIEPFVSYFRDDWHDVGTADGTFDSTSGALTLNLDLVQTIDYEGTRCTVGPVPVTLSTEGSGDVGAGSRFVEGLEGPGALVGSWASVPDPGGSACDLRALQCIPRQSLLRGPGAFGLARGDRELTFEVPYREDWTVDKFGIEGFQRDGGCTPDPIGPGPGPGPGENPIAGPELSVELRRIFTGPRRVRFNATVTNAGGAPATGVKVCAKATRGPRLRPPGCHKIGSVSAGASLTRELTVVLSANRAKRRHQLKQGRMKVTIAADEQVAQTVTRRIRAR